MFADDAITDTQAQARPLANVLVVTNGSKCVRDRQCRCRLSRNEISTKGPARALMISMRAGRAFRDRIVRIIQNVEKHLL